MLTHDANVLIIEGVIDHHAAMLERLSRQQVGELWPDRGPTRLPLVIPGWGHIVITTLSDEGMHH